MYSTYVHGIKPSGSRSSRPASREMGRGGENSMCKSKVTCKNDVKTIASDGCVFHTNPKRAMAKHGQTSESKSCPATPAADPVQILNPCRALPEENATSLSFTDLDLVKNEIGGFLALPCLFSWKS